MNKYLMILKDVDVFPISKIKTPKKYKERQTVRAIVLNKKGEIALVTNPIHNLYTLPGGGAESQNLELEIARECVEEINQEIKIIGTVGRIKEFRNREAKEYITTCFVATAVKYIKKDTRTDDEIKNGLSVIWVDEKQLVTIFDTQNKKIKAGEINFYNTAFNIIRDSRFLNEYLSGYEKY